MPILGVSFGGNKEKVRFNLAKRWSVKQIVANTFQGHAKVALMLVVKRRKIIVIYVRHAF